MPHLSFCGCGFLGVYHLGVVQGLLKHGPRFLNTLDKVGGASAGALAAALVTTCPTPSHVQSAKEIAMSVANEIRKKPLGALTPGYQVTDDVIVLLDEFLPPDAHTRAEGRLFVSLTNVKSVRNEVMGHFESRHQLIEVLAASCHIPVYSGAKFPLIHGKPYCDGGITNNLVRFEDGRTVTVSPFSGWQDIGPWDTVKQGAAPLYLSLRNHNVQISLGNVERFRHALFPPPQQVLQNYFECGQKMVNKFLIQEGFYDHNGSDDEMAL